MAEPTGTAAVQVNGKVAVIRIAGDLTGSADDMLAGAFDEAAATDLETYLLSFRADDHLNSTGIAALIDHITKAYDRGIRVGISHPSAHYRETFEAVALTQYAQIYESDAVALANGPG